MHTHFDFGVGVLLLYAHALNANAQSGYVWPGTTTTSSSQYLPLWWDGKRCPFADESFCGATTSRRRTNAYNCAYNSRRTHIWFDESFAAANDKRETNSTNRRPDPRPDGFSWQTNYRVLYGHVALSQTLFVHGKCISQERFFFWDQWSPRNIVATHILCVLDRGRVLFGSCDVVRVHVICVSFIFGGASKFAVSAINQYDLLALSNVFTTSRWTCGKLNSCVIVCGEWTILWRCVLCVRVALMTSFRSLCLNMH